MAKEYYKQCTLKRGDTTQVAWIPEKYAVKDQYIQIRNPDTNEWVNGWLVMGDGGTRREENQLPDYRKMIRGHRARTGDSLAKKGL